MPPTCGPVKNLTNYLCTDDGMYCFSFNNTNLRTYDNSAQDCEARGGVLAWFKSYEEQVTVEVGSTRAVPAARQARRCCMITQLMRHGAAVLLVANGNQHRPRQRHASASTR
jgi:hypothetical protein